MRFKNKWKLYEFIDKHPYLTGYEIHKKMNWNIKKVMKGVRRLMKDGVVKMDKGNGIYSTPWQEFINWDEMNSKPEDWKR